MKDYSELEEVEFSDIEEADVDKVTQIVFDKFGDSLEGYVEPDIELNDENAAKVIDNGMEAFYDIVEGWIWTVDDEKEELLSEHIDMFTEELGLTSDQLSAEFKNDVYMHIGDDYYVSYATERALDNTTVNVAISYKIGEDFFFGGLSELSVQEDDTIDGVPKGHSFILEMLGSSDEEFIAWYNDAVKFGVDNADKKDDESVFSRYSPGNGLHSVHAKGNTFMYSYYQELENTYDGFNNFVFCTRMSVAEAMDIKRNASKIKITGDGCVGMFDSWNGGGSVLEVEIDEVILDADDFKLIPDESFGYSIDQTYGLTAEAWSNKVEILERKKEEVDAEQ